MTLLQVTHISTVHPVSDIRIFHKQCRSLAVAGMKVNLIITHDKEETIDEVRIIPLSKVNNRFLRIFIKPFFAFAKALKTKADIFHFHDPELIPIGLLLKLCGKKVIYDVHEDVPSQILGKYWIPHSLRGLIAFSFKGVESFSARFFDGIVTATPHIKNIFAPINKNTINVNNYPMSEEIVSFEFLNRKDQQNNKVITYIGGISPERGLVEVVKSLEGTDVKLHLAGEVSPKNFLKTLESCGGWENVVYFGCVSRTEVAAILSNSTAGICTLHPTEAYLHSIPIKIFEYMSVGLPIVVSKFPYWEELLRGVDNAIFVDPFNPEEIRKAFQTLIEDREGCLSMGKRGWRATKETYNWDIEKEKLFELYAKLAVR